MQLLDRLLCDIGIMHEYEGGAACAALRLVPSPACLATLARYRLGWLAVPGGAKIYAAAGTLVPLASFDEAEALDFAIVCDDPDLPAYTDMGLPDRSEGAAGIYYFDNLDCETDPATPQLRLRPARLPLSAPRFRYQAPGSAPAALSVFEHLAGGQAWPAPGVLPAPRAATADLRSLPDGRYSLHSGGVPVRDFFLCHQPRPGLWGVLALYLGSALQHAARPGGAYPIGTDGQRAPQYLRIALAARSYRWRYYIVARPAARAAPDGTIVASDLRRDPGSAPAGQFVALVGPCTVNGQAAAVYASQHDLPLLARPDPLLSYRFRAEGPGMEQGAELALPYAATQQLALDPASSTGLRADIYVYM